MDVRVARKIGRDGNAPPAEKGLRTRSRYSWRLFLSCFAALALCISLVPSLPALADDGGDAATSSDGPQKRRIVLLVDCSDSMDGEPAAQMEEAASRFCEAVVSAEGDNQVAIVPFGFYAYTKLHFSSDAGALKATLSDLPTLFSTNTDGALEHARNLLADFGDDVLSSVVLLSDGLPSWGRDVWEGKYSSGPYFEKRNAAFERAEELKAADRRIYALGFFHSLEGEELDVGRQFMIDVATSPADAYDVVDGADLDFAFGDIAGDITGPGTGPVVVVPGIMGSRLFADAGLENQVWDPDIVPDDPWTYPGFMDDIHKLWDYPLYTKSLVDQRTATEREYGATSIYRTLVDGLCDAYDGQEGKPSREVYFFSYDWRLGCADNASALASFVEGLGGKVDLVCHSMGGLLAARLFDAHPAARANIGKVITIATPYEGAPDAYTKALTTEVLEGWATNQALSFAGLSTELKTSMRSLAELTPTEDYVSVSPMRNLLGSLSFAELLEENSRIFGSESASSALRFQRSANAGGGELLTYDQAYFLVGVNQPTVTSVEFFPILGVNPFGSVNDLGYSMQGDGTVPWLSSTRMQTIDALGEGRRTYRAGEHTELVKNNADTLSWVLDVLKAGRSQQGSDDVNGNRHLVVRIACPVEVEISSGDEALSSDNINARAASFGRLDRIGEAGEIKMAALRPGRSYDAAIRGTGSGAMDMSVRVFDDAGMLVKESEVKGVPVTESSRLSSIVGEGDVSLALDADGDGEDDVVYDLAVDGGAEPNLKLLSAEGVTLEVFAVSGKRLVLLENGTEQTVSLPTGTYAIRASLGDAEDFKAYIDGCETSLSSSGELFIELDERLRSFEIRG